MNKSGQEFPATSWLLVAEAANQRRGDNPALAEFAERYYAAVRAYISAIVRDVLDPEELTQRFFLDVVLSGRLMLRADPDKGRFRSYLKEAIRNFVIDEYRRRKRDESRRSHLNVEGHAKRGELVVSDSSPGPDAELVRAWGKSLVAMAIARVRRLCDEKGQHQHFELFSRRYLTDPDEPPGWREVGAAFHLDEKTARSRADTVVHRFRAVLRELIATDVGSEADANREIQALINLL